MSTCGTYKRWNCETSVSLSLSLCQTACGETCQHQLRNKERSLAAPNLPRSLRTSRSSILRTRLLSRSVIGILSDGGTFVPEKKVHTRDMHTFMNFDFALGKK